MHTWLKHKYAVQKRTGGYRSGHNDGVRRGTQRRKLNDKAKLQVSATQPRVTLLLLPNGKRRFVRELPEKKES